MAAAAMAAASPNGGVSFSREKGKGLISLLGREGRRKKILALISRACAVLACRPKQQDIYLESMCQCVSVARSERGREAEDSVKVTSCHSPRSLQWRIHKVGSVPPEGLDWLGARGLDLAGL